MNTLGIRSKNIKKTSVLLNRLLSSYNIYAQNLISFHWHIKGVSFFDLHQVFEGFYKDARSKIDQIAERTLTLGFEPYSTLSDYLKFSKISEASVDLTDRDMAQVVLENQIILLKIMRLCTEESNRVNDEGTTDLISSYIGEVEKQNWILRTWLHRKGNTIMSAN